MSENQDLRKENQDLFSVRDMLLRDQELVCKENERLLRKLEEVNCQQLQGKFWIHNNHLF